MLYHRGTKFSIDSDSLQLLSDGKEEIKVKTQKIDDGLYDFTVLCDEQIVFRITRLTYRPPQK